MEDEPRGGGLILGAVAMIACCAVPVLIAGGALTGFGAWLSGGGLTWLVVAAIAVAVGFLLLPRRAGETRACTAADGIGRADHGRPKETRPKA